MNIEIKLVLEDNVTEALQSIAKALLKTTAGSSPETIQVTSATPPAKKKPGPKKKAKKAEPEPEQPEENPEANEEPEGELSLEDLRNVGKQLIKARKKEHLKSVLDEYCVENLQEIEEDDYAEVKAKLEEGL